MGYKLDIPNLCAFFASGTVGPNQNIIYTQNGPLVESMTLRCHNVIHELLVKEKTILPPMHIKLALMKQFTKEGQHNKPCFQYLKGIFPKISDAKILKRVYL